MFLFFPVEICANLRASKRKRAKEISGRPQMTSHTEVLGVDENTYVGPYKLL